MYIYIFIVFPNIFEGNWLKGRSREGNVPCMGKKKFKEQRGTPSLPDTSYRSGRALGVNDLYNIIRLYNIFLEACLRHGEFLNIHIIY